MAEFRECSTYEPRGLVLLALVRALKFRFDSGSFPERVAHLARTSLNAYLTAEAWPWSLAMVQERHCTKGSLLEAAASVGNDALIRAAGNDWPPPGVRELDAAMYAAAAKGNADLVSRINWQWGDGDFGAAMRGAAEGGHCAVIRLCYDRGMRSPGMIDDALLCAAKGGHDEAVRALCRDMGAKSTNQAFVLAAKGGHMGTVRLLIEEIGGVYMNGVNGALLAAASGGYGNIVELCLNKYGATDISLAATVASLSNHPELAASLDAKSTSERSGKMSFRGFFQSLKFW